MMREEALAPPLALSPPVAVDRRKKKRPSVSAGRLLTLVALQVVLAFVVSRSGLFEAGDDLGYNIGLVGGLMMSVLLLYPLRKQVRALHWWGAIRFWFSLHMVCGIFGPVLILAHSTFRIGSLNAGVALVSMLLVAASGIVGRFFYTRVHHGLYGEKAKLRELQAELGLDEADMKLRLHQIAPGVEAELLAFEHYALRRDFSPLHRAWRFVTLGEYSFLTRMVAFRELGVALRARAQVRGWDEAKLKRRLAMARALVDRYLRSVCNVAQFGTYERLFSLWHVLHVPLVYLLALSAVAHVVAVHMY